MQPSDFSSACVPIVRLLPSWAGPECWPDTDRDLSKFRRKDVTTCTWGLRLREAPRPQAICAGRMLLSDQRNGVSTSKFDPFRSSIPSPWSPL